MGLGSLKAETDLVLNLVQLCPANKENLHESLLWPGGRFLASKSSVFLSHPTSDIFIRGLTSITFNEIGF